MPTVGPRAVAALAAALCLLLNLHAAQVCVWILAWWKIWMGRFSSGHPCRAIFPLSPAGRLCFHLFRLARRQGRQVSTQIALLIDLRPDHDLGCSNFPNVHHGRRTIHYSGVPYMIREGSADGFCRWGAAEDNRLCAWCSYCATLTPHPTPLSSSQAERFIQGWWLQGRHFGRAGGCCFCR